MNGLLPILQRTGVPSGEGRLHFRNDAERNFLGSIGSQIESNGGVEPGAHGSRDGEPALGKIGEYFFRTALRPKKAEKGQRKGQQAAEQGYVVPVMMGHYDGERARRGKGPSDQILGWA